MRDERDLRNWPVETDGTLLEVVVMAGALIVLMVLSAWAAKG